MLRAFFVIFALLGGSLGASLACAFVAILAIPFVVLVFGVRGEHGHLELKGIGKVLIRNLFLVVPVAIIAQVVVALIKLNK